MQSTPNSISTRDFWSPAFRLVAFVLAATSIWSLLIEFSDWYWMRSVTLLVSLPASVLLVALALMGWAIGTQRLWRAALVGALAGLAVAVAYDVFRLPFVYADALDIQRVIPALKLFKVFPRLGAMILGQPIEQPVYNLAASWLAGHTASATA